MAASTEHITDAPAGAEPQVERSRLARRRERRRLGAPLAEARLSSRSLRRDALFRRALLVADVVALIGAFALTVVTSPAELRLSWAFLAGVPALVIGAKIFGLYDRDEMLLHKTTLEEAPKLFNVATLCALITWLSGGVLVTGGILGRPGVLVLWVALAGLLCIARAVARRVALRLSPPERCLLLGDAAAAATLGPRLGSGGGVKAELVAHVQLEHAAPWRTDACSPPRLAEIRELAQALGVERAIIAPTSVDAGDMLDLVRSFKAVGVRVTVLPRLLEVVGSSVEFDELDGVTVMGVRRFDLTRSSAALKRGFDVLSAALGLLAVAPFMLLAALAIKLDSEGPVFFRQQRVGRHGERFEMLKFRTMVHDADAQRETLRCRNEAQDGLFKIANDPRVTRAGRFLRKTALDELPQLLNIIRGEMSLVGPRPLVVEEDERVAGWHRRRLELTPGMTGPWQILGPTRVSLQEMVAMDYLYVANWSLWIDVKILLRTAAYVFARRGL
jgi:exopolysaccharide biosynthesis polyprenyl glycosylphosphotransferase